jgi:hypothetical protein
LRSISSKSSLATAFGASDARSANRDDIKKHFFRMVSRLFGSNPLDDLIGKLHVLPSLLTGVDRATSEYLPAGQMDLALTLDVCDMIRSKQVPAKQALQSLKRRINHRNPNVQLLALNVPLHPCCSSL